MSQGTRIVYCHCRQAGVIPASVKHTVLEGLTAAGVAFDAIADLCAAAARRDPMLRSIATARHLRIAACYPRAVRSLFEAAGTTLPGEGVDLANMRETDASSTLRCLRPVGSEEAVSSGSPRPIGAPAAAISAPVVLYEGPGAGRLAPTERYALLLALLEAGYDVTCVTDAIDAGETGGRHLDGPAPESGDHERLSRHARARDPVLIGRFETGAGGADSLMASDLMRDRVVIDGHGPQGVLEALGQIDHARLRSRPGCRSAWFPVIDRERCNDCGQCESFCLFGVFDKADDGRMEVVEPTHCKPDCPACARVCPELAIIFPKQPEVPINGAPVGEQHLRKTRPKRDLSALFGGGLRASRRTTVVAGTDAAGARRFDPDRDPDDARRERRRRLVTALRTPPSGRSRSERHAPDGEPSPTADDWGI